MNEIIVKEKTRIEDMIYEIRGKQVMHDSELVVTKCYYYLHDKIVTHYDIRQPISTFMSITDESVILERNYHND